MLQSFSQLMRNITKALSNYHRYSFYTVITAMMGDLDIGQETLFFYH